MKRFDVLLLIIFSNAVDALHVSEREKEEGGWDDGLGVGIQHIQIYDFPFSITARNYNICVLFE